jgi:hypothetical protein
MSSSNDESKESKSKAPSNSNDSIAKGTELPNHELLVDHTYTDYAIISVEDDICLLQDNEKADAELSQPCSEREEEVRERLREMPCTYGPKRKNTGGVTKPFPGKLHEVLERTDLAEIIEWMSHGRAFLVKQPKTFASQVLPRYFKQTKYLSFTRQLNLWGFKRITRGKDMGAYYHELFLRGRPHLAMRMKRQKIKGTGMKLTPDPDREPNFYNDYSMLPPLKRCEGPLPPLPPLPVDQMGLLQQALTQDDAKESSSGGDDGMYSRTGLMAVTSGHPHELPPTVLTHPQLQQIHHQQQSMASGFGMGVVGGHHLPRVYSDHFLVNAAAAGGGMNSVYLPETLHHIHQQQFMLQQHQLQHQLANHHHHHQPMMNGTNNSDYQQLYASMNDRHSAGMGSVLAAASRLPQNIPSTLLSPNQFTHAAAGSHIANRADEDVLLAPGVRRQLGLSANLNGNGASSAIRGGIGSTAKEIKDELSAMFRNYDGVRSPSAASAASAFNTHSAMPPLSQLKQAVTTQEMLKTKGKDNPADRQVSDTASSGATSSAAKTTDADESKESKSSPTLKDVANDPLQYALQSVSNDPLQDALKNQSNSNDPLQDALKNVANDPLLDALKKINNTASLKHAKAKVLQSLTSFGEEGGAEPAENGSNGKV